MKLLILALSSTLIQGAAVPGHDNGVIEYHQHEGPHCRDMKDQVCHKKPKESEHEETKSGTFYRFQIISLKGKRLSDL